MESLCAALACIHAFFTRLCAGAHVQYVHASTLLTAECLRVLLPLLKDRWLMCRSTSLGGMAWLSTYICLAPALAALLLCVDHAYAQWVDYAST